MFPWDNVNRSDDPSGIRIGTQEITRRGLKESHMSEIAAFIKRVTVDEEEIKEEVTEFITQHNKVHYAFKEDEAYKYVDF